jgi:UTP--glucose-1-phosphate uridylyltransferase
MRIQKAVITAAARGQNLLPLQTLVDRDGVQKSALRIILEEATSSGVDEICLVVRPGDQAAYAAAAGDLASRLHFVEQHQPRGYGHALHCAREFVANDPFLHLVSDHLYVSREPTRCALQLVKIAESESCAVSAVQSTRESVLTHYGAIGGRLVAGRNRLYEVEEVLEKPTPTEAEQKLIVPGLRQGHYLCFFGMHVLTPTVMQLLGEQISGNPASHSIQLSPALAALARRERYMAAEVHGVRYNIGMKYGLLVAQLALALDGGDRDEILAQMVELLASRESKSDAAMSATGL